MTTTATRGGLRLPFDTPIDGMVEDLDRIHPQEWVPHFNRVIYTGDWSAVPLRSVGGQMGSVYPDPTGTMEFADTPLLARCPAYQRVLASFSCEVRSARLLRLGARSAIHEHRDDGLCFEAGEARLHVPVTTDPAVECIVGGESLDMAPGECWYVNVNLPHRVVNPTDRPRVHMIIDCVVDDWLRGIFELARAGR